MSRKATISMVMELKVIPLMNNNKVIIKKHKNKVQIIDKKVIFGYIYELFVFIGSNI